MKSISIICWIPLVWAPLLPISAQTAPPPPPPPARVMVIALGPDPGEFYAETSSPNPVTELRLPEQLPEGYAPPSGGLGMFPEIMSPPEGSLPPDQIYYRIHVPEPERSAQDPEEIKREGRIRLRLNRSSSPSSLPSGLPISFFTRTESGEEEPLFKTAALPPDGVLLIILRPKGTGALPWEEGIESERLPISSSRLEGKELVVKNYASRTVRFMFSSTDVQELAPGSWKAYDAEAGNQLVPLVATTPGARKPFLYSSIRLPVNQLTFMAFYAANPDTNRGHATGFMRTVLPRPTEKPSPPPAPNESP